ncbi:hypothetical protein FIU87_12990 [Bacillus sp. THAF10]|nr:hypothetical protein FIU87_12990 [Bacillus sp. THAF10]
MMQWNTLLCTYMKGIRELYFPLVVVSNLFGMQFDGRNRRSTSLRLVVPVGTQEIHIPFANTFLIKRLQLLPTKKKPENHSLRLQPSP